MLIAVVISFGKTWIHFRIRRHYRRMPLVIGFFFVYMVCREYRYGDTRMGLPEPTQRVDHDSF